MSKVREIITQLNVATSSNTDNDKHEELKAIYKQLLPYAEIEEELGINLLDLLKAEDPDTCFMEIRGKDTFYLCGDAYCGNFDKVSLLNFIKNLIFMYRNLIKLETEGK